MPHAVAEPTRKYDEPKQASAVHRLRVMTYNVHGCVGMDLRFDPERIARVIEAAGADVVALQEIYVEDPRRDRLHQAAWLAERLGMHFEFGAARDCEGGCRYGNAVLSRHRMRVLRAESLPRFRSFEPRAALRVELSTPLGDVDVVNTHLGLRPRERALQTSALARDWLSHVGEQSTSILCGDLNAVPGSPVYTTIAGLLEDAERYDPGRRPAKTWPSFFPVMRLDHVFIGRGLDVVGWRVPSSRVERVASDHLPVTVDVAPKARSDAA